ncbi:sensor histidine kinase [Lactiplantibacillus plantarum]|uniref:sensor histidine kinase n=1 Tax=Lactiplantibacillus plantarum TaxID=1590 RepID=UPI001402DB15|nr:GHKL domain-containing protein [Lactiplantibacillus plantarum]
MLMIVFQELSIYLIIKSLLRNIFFVRLFDVIFLSVCMLMSYIFLAKLGISFSFLMLMMFIFFTWWYVRVLSGALCITFHVFIWSIMVDHICDILTRLMKVPNGYVVVFVILSVVSLIFLNIVMDRTNFSPTFSNQSLNRITALLLMIIYLYIMLSEGLENQFQVILSNLIILSVVMGLVLVIYNEYLKNVRAKYEVQKQRIQIQNDTRYMNEIEAHYNELRRFRHDYQNMLISIDEYLKTDDLEGLQEYYQKNLAPVSNRVLKEKYNLEDLSRVKVKSIKSILFSKLSYAQSQEIEVHFDLKEPLIDITVNELDLDIALGIMLDNAIEASVGHADGEIMSAIFIEKNSTVFLIQNNVFEQLPPLWKLKEAGYSTKGKNRGIGLNSLSKIVNRNENMILETRVLGAVFLQRLTVKRVSQND